MKIYENGNDYRSKPTSPRWETRRGREKAIWERLGTYSA